jgi:hypothetical protein
MALLCQQYALATSQAFRDRIYVSMVSAAIAIQGETKTLSDSAHGKRQALATAVLNNPLAHLDRFAIGCAAITAAGSPELDISAPVAISSSTVGPPVVVTTAAAHGMATGDTVVISGHLANTALNNAGTATPGAGSPSSWSVTVLTTTTYSVPTIGTAAGANTGISTRQPSDTTIANFGPFSQWSDFAGVVAGE